MLLFLDQAEDAHANWVEGECREREIPFYRFCTEQFPHEANITLQMQGDHFDGIIRTPDREVSLRDVTGIWHRRPGAVTPHPDMDPLYERYALMESIDLLDGLYRALWDRRWVSPPHILRASSHKVFQLRLAGSMGLTVVPTIVTNNPDEAAEFFHRVGKQMIYKTLRQIAVAYDDEAKSAYGIFTTLIGEAELEEHLESVKYIPCLFQKLVPKKYELRINVIGNYVWATALHTQEIEDPEAKIDFRRWTEQVRHEPVILPPEIERICLKMTRDLGLRMSSIDFIVTPDDDYVFLELNPSAQWAWIEHMVGFPLRTALVDELLGVDTLANHPYIKERSLIFEPIEAVQRLRAQPA